MLSQCFTQNKPVAVKKAPAAKKATTVKKTTKTPTKRVLATKQPKQAAVRPTTARSKANAAKTEKVASEKDKADRRTKAVKPAATKPKAKATATKAAPKKAVASKAKPAEKKTTVASKRGSAKKVGCRLRWSLRMDVCSSCPQAVTGADKAKTAAKKPAVKKPAAKTKASPKKAPATKTTTSSRGRKVLYASPLRFVSANIFLDHSEEVTDLWDVFRTISRVPRNRSCSRACLQCFPDRSRPPGTTELYE
jgi:hypothetical protein